MSFCLQPMISHVKAKEYSAQNQNLLKKKKKIMAKE